MWSAQLEVWRSKEMKDRMPNKLLKKWLIRQVEGPAYEWFVGQQETLIADPSARNLYITLGMIPRRLGKGDLQLSIEDLERADSLRPGWNPKYWSVDVAARVTTLLTTFDGAGDFAAAFVDVCRGADVGERMAYYSGLPLYAKPHTLNDQVAEGLRTNMRSEFEAIAHRNPFPFEQFDDHRWNHMVLKALFVDSTLYPIQGLDARANSELAQILCDYAHERWAAGRSVTPELWRCVGPYAEGSALEDLERVLGEGNPVSRQAAVLALNACPASGAQDLLDTVPELRSMMASGALSWKSFKDGARAL